MRHYKIAFGLIVTFGIFLLAACSQKNNIDQEESSLSSVAGGKAVQVELPEGLEIIRDSAKFQTVTEHQNYNFDTDNQYGIPNNYAVAESEDAWYFIEQNAMLYIWDKESKEYAPLCSKPDCKHLTGSSGCDAFIGDAWELYYYDKNLYTIVRQTDTNENNQHGEKLVLKKISLDGTVKEDVCTIAQCYVSEGSEYDDDTFTIMGIVHRGYLYYTYNFGTGGGNLDVDYYNNGSNILYRIKLDGSEESQCILALKECGAPETMCMKGVGSYLYFIDSQWDFYGILYRLNTESMQLEQMDVGKIYTGTYAVLGDKIIYKEEWNDTVLYSYIPETGEKSVFADLSGEKEDLVCGELMFDGNCFYVYFISEENYNYWTVDVLDTQGNKTGQFSFYEQEEDAKEGVKIYAGMGDLFLCSTGYEDVRRNLYYLDKTKILDGTAEFVEGNK